MSLAEALGRTRNQTLAFGALFLVIGVVIDLVTRGGVNFGARIISTLVAAGLWWAISAWLEMRRKG
ncbi:MAG: hypothetical protein JJU40_08050 [Rhodobacteraceae bacterium]|nr:hypothetical protein [Paracoccaceae bacterium]